MPLVKPFSSVFKINDVPHEGIRVLYWGRVSRDALGLPMRPRSHLHLEDVDRGLVCNPGMLLSAHASSVASHAPRKFTKNTSLTVSAFLNNNGCHVALRNYATLRTSSPCTCDDVTTSSKVYKRATALNSWLVLRKLSCDTLSWERP